MNKLLILAVIVGVIAADPSWLGTWLITSSYSTNVTYCGHPKVGTNATVVVDYPGFDVNFVSAQGGQLSDYFGWDPSQLSGNASFSGWYEAGNMTVVGNLLYANLFLNHTAYAGSWCGWTMVRYNANMDAEFDAEEFSDGLVFMTPRSLDTVQRP